MANALRFVIHDVTEEETKILSPRLLYHTRERHHSWSFRVWNLRRLESSHTAEEERVRLFRGHQDIREGTTAEDGSNSLRACCAEGPLNLVLHVYNKAVTAECFSCTSVSFRIGPGYNYVATSPKD